MRVVHTFVSPKSEQSDPSIVGPNEWNADHTILDDTAVVVPGIAHVLADDYNFTPQLPGGSLVAGISNTVSLTPVPLGVNGSDVGHRLCITGGSGASEAVLITGGSAVSGSPSGTITFVPANNHSGAWQISSGSMGIQEAINAPIPGNSRCVDLLPKTYTICGTIYLRPGLIIQGAGKSDMPVPLGNSTPGGTLIDGSALTTGWVFDWLSPIQASPYGINSAFVFKDFTIKCGLHGFRINNDTMPTSGNQAFLTDGIVFENIYFVGGQQCVSDPNANTAVIPTLSGLKAFGTAVCLTFVFRVRLLSCKFYYFGIPIYIHGDENLINSCECSLSSIGIYVYGKDPSSSYPSYGNKNIISHVKFGGLYRLGAIWQDTCGGSIIRENYFEIDGPMCQYVRVLNSQLCDFGPNNWVQSPSTASTTPSFHFQMRIEALIHNNMMLQGPTIANPMEIDYSTYNPNYPNIVRMSDNGSFFPQPGNRTMIGGGTYSTYPGIPGVLVGDRNTMVLNAFNNPSDFAFNSTGYPWVRDPITNRWALSTTDATMNSGGFIVWFTLMPSKHYRSFNLVVLARKSGTGVVYVNLQYTGNTTTTIFSGNLTFTTTTETSTQTSGPLSIPATETTTGFFQINIVPAQAFIEQVELISLPPLT